VTAESIAPDWRCVPIAASSKLAKEGALAALHRLALGLDRGVGPRSSTAASTVAAR
jgi:hypothetical protein